MINPSTIFYMQGNEHCACDMVILSAGRYAGMCGVCAPYAIRCSKCDNRCPDPWDCPMDDKGEDVNE